LDILAPDEILKVGGAGHKVMLLMEGKAHAYVFPSPGHIMVEIYASKILERIIQGFSTESTNM